MPKACTAKRSPRSSDLVIRHSVGLLVWSFGLSATGGLSLLRSLLADHLVIVIRQLLVLLNDLLIGALDDRITLAFGETTPLGGLLHDVLAGVGGVVGRSADALGLSRPLPGVGLGLARLALVHGLCAGVGPGLLALGLLRLLAGLGLRLGLLLTRELNQI